jgi:hypothetical protein
MRCHRDHVLIFGVNTIAPFLLRSMYRMYALISALSGKPSRPRMETTVAPLDAIGDKRSSSIPRASPPT